MTPLFKKLNWKAHHPIWVLNAPASFEAELVALGDEVEVVRELGTAAPLSFVLVFATKQNEVDQLAQAIAVQAEGDAVVWFAYPKASSKKYQCEFNRDTGWGMLGQAGFEPVRQVAIDGDWSALRFRRVAYIKKLTRTALGAISEEGRARLEE